MSRVENQIIARFRDGLGTARNANEMFRVFSKFNSLFVRPKVLLSLPIVIFLLNDVHVDSWCDTGLLDSSNRIGKGGH